MSNLLKDLLPDAPREKSILVAAAEAGLANSLRQHVDQGMDPNTAIRLTASSFSSTTPFTPDACTWVTGEIATALGISHGGGPGSGGTPGGFDPIGQQGMPTQAAPIPGARFQPGLQPTQGYGQAPGQGGFGAGGQGAAPGGWQAGGQPGGGYGGQPGAAPPGAGQPGAGQPGGWQGGGYAPPGGGQPAGGFGGQAGGGGWQGGGGYAPPGGAFGPQPGGYQPAAPTGPMGPMMPGGIGGPVKPRGGRRGLLVAGGLVAALIVVIVIGASLSGGGSPTPTPTPVTQTSSEPPQSPTASPTPTHPPGTDSLVSIMNPVGATAVGTDCGPAKLFGMKASTIVARTYCRHTTHANIVVWGYQFDSKADYQAGLHRINHYVGFDQVTPGTSCPPPSGHSEGKVGWHANHNPKYKSKTGQDIECLIDAKEPVLIWTMPTQDVFFIGEDQVKGSSIHTIVKWWETLDYGR